MCSSDPSRGRAIRSLAAAGALALAATLLQPAPLYAADKVELKEGFPVTSRKAIYKLSDVKVGDRGVGYTVFAGDRIKPFDVEVLGILQGMLGPHRDVILARLSGPDIEFTGVIAGMSGSPVYIDGRLLGAVSYRFGAFSKEPIAGITPIESMLEIYGSGGDVTPPPLHRPKPLERTHTVTGGRAPIQLADRKAPDRAPAIPAPLWPALSGPHDPRPIDTPIVLAGFAPEVAADLKGKLESAGMVVTIGGMALGARDPESSPRRTGKAEQNTPGLVAGGGRAAPIAPGAPIAAMLMRGDLSAAGTGTVTFVEDGVVLGFGHPFFGYGHVVFPMATASILNTLASLSGSFKQASPAREVGAIVHDRLTAIGGSLGSVAPMIPTRVKVEHPDRAMKPILTNVEVVEHDLWTPILIDAAIASAAHGRLGSEAGGTIDFEAIYQVGDRTLRIQDSYSALPPTPVGAMAAHDIANIAAILLRNGLEWAHVKSVEVNMRARSEIEFSWLEEVVPERTVVRPGEKVRALARLRPWRGKAKTVPFEIQVPQDASGDIELFVGGSGEVDRRDQTVMGDRIPEDLDDLLGLLSERRPGRGLYARVYMTRPGLRANAEVLSSLPISQRVTLAQHAGIAKKAITEAMGPEARVTVPEIVSGSLSVSLRVVRP